ncbi:MAG TPA: hypothetical protein VI818_04375, partial [Candidatus Thermoplasmatota archaeon]|nr:hypothetical protein [Candidatus Thermoplasmatota archaeon]
DAALVEAEFQKERPAQVLLGVPYEDLDSVRATLGKEAESEFESGELDEAYLLRLGQYGPVRSPPPDLYRAYQLADSLHLKAEAIDLGDEAFTERYTKHVGMFEVLRSNRSQRRLALRQFDASTGEAFAMQWDDALYPTRGLRKVQDEREAHMVDRIQELAKGPGLHFVLLPLARAIGVYDKLLGLGWTVDA